jgi:hypothetical protein
VIGVLHCGFIATPDHERVHGVQHNDTFTERYDLLSYKKGR